MRPALSPILVAAALSMLAPALAQDQSGDAEAEEERKDLCLEPLGPDDLVGVYSVTATAYSIEPKGGGRTGGNADARTRASISHVDGKGYVLGDFNPQVPPIALSRVGMMDQNWVWEAAGDLGISSEDFELAIGCEIRMLPRLEGSARGTVEGSPVEFFVHLIAVAPGEAYVAFRMETEFGDSKHFLQLIRLDPS